MEAMKIKTPAQLQAAEELAKFFGPDGEIVTKYGGKFRFGQVEMAKTVNDGFYDHVGRLMEAPTGTGKTLAYLVPIALFLRRNPQNRFVISVATKHLQSQIETDLERLGDEFPELRASHVLKGANNYLCLNRLKRAAQRPHSTKQVELEIKTLMGCFEELEKMPHGWREELPSKVTDYTWSLINGEGTCCKSFYGCFRRQAKKLAEKAKIVVVNTDLLGYNVKYTGKPVPTDKKFENIKPYLILDEAHTLHNRLTEVESADVSFRSLEGIVNTLARDTQQRHSFLKPQIIQIIQELESIRGIITNGPDGQQVIKPDEGLGIPCRQLAGTIEKIQKIAETLGKDAPNEEVAEDYQDMEHKLSFSAHTLKAYLNQEMDNYVLLLNRSTSPNGYTAVSLELKPFGIEEPLERLWNSFKQISLVSATLIGTSIAETKKAFNAKTWEASNFPSPFEYRRQLRVFLPPRHQDLSTPVGVAETIKKVASITDGRVMALFTNYKNIAETNQLLQPWCAEQGIQLYVQERNLNSEVLVERYKENDRAIILGNQSMGTGIDIRLRALILTKLPFDQRTAYHIAKEDHIRSKGGNPFRDDTLPATVRKWRQWWGRLIRTENQRGMLVLLDPKLNTAQYAIDFIRSLPSVSKSTHLDDPHFPLPTKEQFLAWIGNDIPQTTPDQISVD